MKNFKTHLRLSFFMPFVLIVCIDQVTKWWARGQGIVVVNSGVSFGLGSSAGVWFFVLLTLAILVSLIFVFREVWQKNRVVFGLLSGAAISNAVDRVRWGGVQDFLPIRLLHLQNNLADWVIFGCMLWIGYRILLSRERR